MSNFSIDEEMNRLKALYRRDNNLDPIKGTVGNAFGVVAVPGRPGYVFVRQITSNGLSSVKPVLAPSGKSMALNPGDAVELEYTKDHQLRIAEPDTIAQIANGVDPVAVAQQQQSPSTPQSNLETLRLVVKSGLIVSLKGLNATLNSMYYEVSYPDIDLSSHVPVAVSGVPQMRYVGVLIKRDLTDVDLVDSTPRAIADLPLNPADVNEILAASTPGDTPAKVVKLVTGQTAILQSDLDSGSGGKDLRQVVNLIGVYKYTPSATADTAGATGDVTWDNSYVYVKTGAGWKRSALSTF